MKLPTALLFIALWVAREAIALPFEDFSLASIDGNDTTTAEQLFARDATDNYQKCGKHQYLIKDLNNAETRGLNIALGKGKKVRGANNKEYPAPFGNKDNEINVARTICAEPDATLREWPILRNGKLFQANKGPGPDRILFGIIRHKNSPPISAVCGLITHTGAPTKNGFVRCDGWD